MFFYTFSPLCSDSSPCLLSAGRLSQSIFYASFVPSLRYVVVFPLSERDKDNRSGIKEKTIESQDCCYIRKRNKDERGNKEGEKLAVRWLSRRKRPKDTSTLGAVEYEYLIIRGAKPTRTITGRPRGLDDRLVGNGELRSSSITFSLLVVFLLLLPFFCILFGPVRVYFFLWFSRSFLFLGMLTCSKGKGEPALRLISTTRAPEKESKKRIEAAGKRRWRTRMAACCLENAETATVCHQIAHGIVAPFLSIDGPMGRAESFPQACKD